PTPGEGPGQGSPDQPGAEIVTTEVVQGRLIVDNVPGVAAWPPDWRSQGGAEFFYRENACLVRDWHAPRVLDALRGQGLEGSIQELPGSLTRITWPGGPPAPTVLGQLERQDVERPLQPGFVTLEHLLYVCPKACAATEPKSVGPDAPPVPRPQIGEDAADPRCRHGKDVEVRILDTGVVDGAAEHYWTREVSGEPDRATGTNGQLLQDGGHGTFVAGCVRVTAPESTVCVVNATVGVTVGTVGAAWETELASKVREQFLAPAQTHPIAVPQILLVNFAGTTQNDAPPLAFTALYDDVVQHLKEVLIISPAGNDGDTRKNWPASFSWVVSVGALAENWRDRATWSSYGPHVDVYAPGEELVNAYASGTYTCTWPPDQGVARTFEGMARWSGTSFSTPLVAGLVASRMSTTGQSSRRAWLDLLDLAERQAIPGVGPVLYPGQGCGTRRGDCGCR
ncbi:MAG: S8 family peptidase, partial [Kineosporiaceae bacterium]